MIAFAFAFAFVEEKCDAETFDRMTYVRTMLVRTLLNARLDRKLLTYESPK